MTDNLFIMTGYEMKMMSKTGGKIHGSLCYFNPANYGIYVKNYINLYYTVTFYSIDTYKKH